MSQEQHAPPPQATIFGFVTSIWAAQAVATFAKLGIADLLAKGPKNATELAAATGSNPDALYRLLRGVAAVNVLAAAPDGRFSLPADFAEAIDVSEGVVLAGMGEKFQLWNPKRWQARREADRAKMAAFVRGLDA